MIIINKKERVWLQSTSVSKISSRFCLKLQFDFLLYTVDYIISWPVNSCSLLFNLFVFTELQFLSVILFSLMEGRDLCKHTDFLSSII